MGRHREVNRYIKISASNLGFKPGYIFFGSVKYDKDMGFVIGRGINRVQTMPLVNHRDFLHFIHPILLSMRKYELGSFISWIEGTTDT